jgi:hypothetical protein
MSVNGRYFFIHHPSYGSFTLVYVEGDTDRLPDGFRDLMPGSLDDVEMEQVHIEECPRWIAHLKERCPDWIEELHQQPAGIVEGVCCRQVSSWAI